MLSRQSKLQKKRNYAKTTHWTRVWDQWNVNYLNPWGRQSLYYTLVVPFALIGKLIQLLNFLAFYQFHHEQYIIQSMLSRSRATIWPTSRIDVLIEAVDSNSFPSTSKSISALLQYCNHGVLWHWQNAQRRYQKSSKTSQSHLTACVASIERMVLSFAIHRWSIAVI